MVWIDWCVADLESARDLKPDGFNIGLNDGAAAGQTIAQLRAQLTRVTAATSRIRVAVCAGSCPQERPWQDH